MNTILWLSWWRVHLQCRRLPAVQETWVRSLGQEIPWCREWHPLQYSCLGNPVDGGAWLARVHAVQASHREPDTTSCLTHRHQSILCCCKTECFLFTSEIDCLFICLLITWMSSALSFAYCSVGKYIESITQWKVDSKPWSIFHYQNMYFHFYEVWNLCNLTHDYKFLLNWWQTKNKTFINYLLK